MYVEGMNTGRTVTLSLVALLLSALTAQASYTAAALPGSTPLAKKALMGENRAESHCCGEQWDPNAGFYYLRARWMSPEVGRFTSVDPYPGNAVSPSTLHTYSYSRMCPVSYADPTGRSYTFVGLMAAIGISLTLPTLAQASTNVALPIIHFDLLRQVKSATTGVGVDMEGRVTGRNADKEYFVVQWVKGHIVHNSNYQSAPHCGGVYNFADYVVDAPCGNVLYPDQKAVDGRVDFWDGAGFWLYGNQQLRSTDVVDVHLDLVLTVHKKTKYPNPSPSQFKSPWNPMPEASAPWHAIVSWP